MPDKNKKNLIDTNSKAQLRTTPQSSEFGSELSHFSANSFDVVLGRMMAAIGTQKAVDVANALGISQQSISSAKAKQKIPAEWYIQVAEASGASMDWLVTGEGEMRRGAAPAATQAAAERPARLAEAPAHYNDSGENFDMGEVLAQTIDILNSKTVYTTAIVSNIKAFHKAITTEKKIDDMQHRLDQTLTSFQAQLDQLHVENEEIRARNQQLLEDVDHLRSRLALENTG